MEIKRLHKSSSDKVLFGVCGGMGEYFGMDSLIVRLLFVLLTLMVGSGVLLYIVCALLIPDEVRLLTILDVFDALTARDRPYKPGMPVEKALSILHSMVDEGAMDNDILTLFEESKAWEERK